MYYLYNAKPTMQQSIGLFCSPHNFSNVPSTFNKTMQLRTASQPTVMFSFVEQIIFSCMKTFTRVVHATLKKKKTKGKKY